MKFEEVERALSSLRRLCKKLGGRYERSVEDEYEVATCTLPKPIEVNLVELAPYGFVLGSRELLEELYVPPGAWAGVTWRGEARIERASLTNKENAIDSLHGRFVVKRIKAEVRRDGREIAFRLE